MNLVSYGRHRVSQFLNSQHRYLRHGDPELPCPWEAGPNAAAPPSRRAHSPGPSQANIGKHGLCDRTCFMFFSSACPSLGQNAQHWLPGELCFGSGFRGFSWLPQGRNTLAEGTKLLTSWWLGSRVQAKTVGKRYMLQWLAVRDTSGH